MHHLEVTLVLFAPSLTRKGEFRCLLMEREKNFEMLTVEVQPGQTSLDAAAEHLERTMGFKAKRNGSGWVELEQMPIVEDGELVTVPYSAVIPETIAHLSRDQDVKWVPITEAFMALSDHDKAILQGAKARM